VKKACAVSLVALLSSATGVSYRFICNGILANGDVRSDECGICDDEHAARWGDPHIAVVVDDQTLPAKMTRADWQRAVSQSFQAWESITGTNLRFIQQPSPSPHEFGANDDVHEIFWITKSQEWRKLVGSGEFTTLGATLPRYSCGGARGAKRTIFDADLVLNGIKHINWKVDCPDEEDCTSVQTTLVHELGHFFGLDHPCLMCNTSIMSARAGFNLTYPVLDDMEGLRVLYPDGSAGGFGFPCKEDKDCDRENRCIADSPHRYCSHDCNDDEECYLGAVCKDNQLGKMCGFMRGESLRQKKEGENCLGTICEEPLLCAGASEPNFFCYSPCAEEKDCEPDEACVGLDDGGGVCVTIKARGEICNHRDLCEEELYCVFDKLSSGFCLAPCVATTTANNGCFASEVCEKIEGVELCLPKNQALMLDEATDGFIPNESEAKAVTDKKEDKKLAPAQGCHNIGQHEDDGGFFILFCILAILLAQTRGRKSLHLPEN